MKERVETGGPGLFEIMGVATLRLYPHMPRPRNSELPWPSAPLLWQSSADAEAVVCSKACTVLNWRTVV